MKSFSAIHSIRGVVRPAFQMAVDDDILRKNPFGFQVATVLVNDTVTCRPLQENRKELFSISSKMMRTTASIICVPRQYTCNSPKSLIL